MYVCMYVCTYVCMYVWYIYIYIYIYNDCLQATQQLVRAHTHTHMYVCMYVCMCVCVCIYIYIYIYIWLFAGRPAACACTHTHTHTHTHTYILFAGRPAACAACLSHQNRKLATSNYYDEPQKRVVKSLCHGHGHGHGHGCRNVDGNGHVMTTTVGQGKWMPSLEVFHRQFLKAKRRGSMRCKSSGVGERKQPDRNEHLSC